ncbi:MAG TPA: hypothetical protein VN642_05005 [Dongiaceae bacterium]|nr:hypothetical protein [Dongiaceae bacterium]
MAAIVKCSTTIIRLVFGAAIWCSFAGCTGALIYRPEKKQKLATPGTETDKQLPPMPDLKANNSTLAGIDTTGMGIRDDVYIWIYENYTTTIKRTILMTMAKTLQDVMAKTPKTTEEARHLEQSFKDASIMLKAVRGLTQGEADEMGNLLFKKMFNTPERLNAYLQYNLLLRGGTSAH